MKCFIFNNEHLIVTQYLEITTVTSNAFKNKFANSTNN